MGIDMPQTQQQIIDLQTKISYIEDFVGQLQQVVTEHEKTLQELLEYNKLLSSKLQDIQETIALPPANQRPPHY